MTQESDVATDEVEAEVILKNKYGLHARPATLIAQTAKAFECDISLEKEGSRADAKSIFSTLTLAAECGDLLVLRARGADADAAIAKLSELIANLEVDD